MYHLSVDLESQMYEWYVFLYMSPGKTVMQKGDIFLSAKKMSPFFQIQNDKSLPQGII